MVIYPRNSYSIEINDTYFCIVILGKIYTANLLFKEVDVSILFAFYSKKMYLTIAHFMPFSPNGN